MGASPSPPPVPQMPAPPPPPPTPVDDVAIATAKQTKAKFAAAGGLGSTLLTGGPGDTSNPNLQRKTVFGA